MNELNLSILGSAFEDCIKGNNKAFLVADKMTLEIDTSIAAKLNVGDVYCTYNPRNPYTNPDLVKNFANPYIVVGRVFDEHNNLILLAEEQEKIDFE